MDLALAVQFTLHPPIEDAFVARGQRTLEALHILRVCRQWHEQQTDEEYPHGSVRANSTRPSTTLITSNFPGRG